MTVARYLRKKGLTWQEVADVIYADTNENFAPVSVRRAVAKDDREAQESMREQAAAMRGTS